jgi:hypothetical protein
VTDSGPLTVRIHVGLVPEHDPDQPTNLYPLLLSGLAVSMTGAPTAYGLEQVVPQFISLSEDLTLPPTVLTTVIDEIISPTLTDLEVVPPGPVHDKLNVLLRNMRPELCTPPDIDFEPLQLPDAVHEVTSPDTLQFRLVDDPDAINEVSAQKFTTGGTELLTVNGTHGPQLLPSFDSVTVPTKLVSRSAQTRAECVPTGNVEIGPPENVIGADPLPAREAIDFCIVISTEALLFKSICKMFLNEDKISLEPRFETDAVMDDTLVLFILVKVTIGSSAVRSG